VKNVHEHCFVRKKALHLPTHAHQQQHTYTHTNTQTHQQTHTCTHTHPCTLSPLDSESGEIDIITSHWYAYTSYQQLRFSNLSTTKLMVTMVYLHIIYITETLRL